MSELSKKKESQRQGFLQLIKEAFSRPKLHINNTEWSENNMYYTNWFRVRGEK